MFIAVEGIDGAGKSTHVKYMADLIAKKFNREVVTTREPGGTKAAEVLRNFVLSKPDENFPVDAEILLFNAARIFHVENLIKPSVEQGKIVISDRFADSTFAYQCAHGADYDRVKAIHDWSMKGFKPDYTFFFFISPEVAKSRVDVRKGKDRFDEETGIKDITEKKMSMFLKRMNESDSKCFFIDSSKEVENTQMQIAESLDYIFGKA